MYGFTPDPYESVPELLQDQRLVDRPRFLTWKQNHVGVSCEGMTAADRENLNEVKYYPEGGFSEVRTNTSDNNTGFSFQLGL